MDGDPSSTPEEIWRHIISFLPIDEAVRSSMICRLLRKVWFSSPNLIFHYHKFPTIEDREEKFVQFLQGTLNQHDMSSITNFEIEMPVTECLTELQNEWIAFAIAHNAQHLYLNGKVDLLGLPSSFFKSKSLAKIDFVLPDYVLDCQESIFLPNLKEFRLRAVTIGYSFEEILKGCPVLETLSMVFCNFELLKTLNFSSSTLQNLTISHSEFVENCKLGFFTPMLIKLIIMDYIALDYEFLCNFTPHMGFISLRNPFPLESSMGALGSSAFNLFRGLYKADHDLSLYPWFIEIISWNPNFLHEFTTVSFDHLECLHLCIWPIKRHVSLVLLILTKVPSIRTLQIIMMKKQGSNATNRLATACLIKAKYFEILKHLTDVSIYGFEEHARQLKLVKILLENAPKLAMLKISKTLVESQDNGSDSEDVGGISTVIKDKIGRFNKLSSTVTVVFC